MPWKRQTFDELPALRITGDHLRRSLRMVTMGWMFGVVWMVTIGGSRMTYLGQMVGFNDFEFGVLAALPFIATFAQLFAAIVIEKTHLRKYQFIYFALIHRALWLLVAAVPLILPVPSQMTVWVMLVIMLISWFCSQIHTPAWFSWMGDLIPRRIRGRYFGRRMRYAQLVQAPAVLIMAYIMTQLKHDGDMTIDNQRPLFYAILASFVMAAFFGMADVLCFWRIREIKPPHKESPPVFKTDLPTPKGTLQWMIYPARFISWIFVDFLLLPLKDKNFLRIVGFLAFFSASAAMAGPFTWLNALDFLNFSQLGAETLYLVIGPIFGLIFAPLLGRVVDIWGRKRALILGSILTFCGISPVFFAQPGQQAPAWVVQPLNHLAGWIGGWFGNPELVWITPESSSAAYLWILGSVFCGGLGWGLIGLAQTGILMGFSESAGRSKYIAASSVWISLGGILGGLLGGALAEAFEFISVNKGHPYALTPFIHINNWHISFMGSATLRLTALFWLIGFTEPTRGVGVPMLRQFGTNVYNYVNSRLFLRWRTYGWKPAGLEHRQDVQQARRRVDEAKAVQQKANHHVEKTNTHARNIRSIMRDMSKKKKADKQQIKVISRQIQKKQTEAKQVKKNADKQVKKAIGDAAKITKKAIEEEKNNHNAQKKNDK